MRWLRKPPLHFVVIGVGLFALGRYRAAPLPITPRPLVVITAERLAQARAQIGPATASAPAPDEDGLVARAVDDEILYHEALARGLDRRDPSVRWRLVEKMRFIVDGEASTGVADDEHLYEEAMRLGLDQDDAIVRGILVRQMRLLLARVADEQLPDDAELAAYLDRHRERFAEPGRVTLWHVFLANDRRGAAAARDGEHLLTRLRTNDTSPGEAVRLGDAFPAGAHFRGQSASDLMRLFGADFAHAALALDPGSLSGPLRSSYGVHVVWIEEKEPVRTPSFEVVRPQVLAHVLQDRREARLAAALRELRAKYAVRVEPTDGGRG